jgi:hypothetical protein
VRHAESQSNAGFITNDPAKISLTEEGRQNAIDFVVNIDARPAYFTSIRWRYFSIPLSLLDNADTFSILLSIEL